MQKKWLFVFFFFLLLILSIVLPFCVIHFGVLDHSSNEHGLRYKKSLSQKIIDYGAEKPQRNIFGLDTPQLHSGPYDYDNIYKSNGTHESYQDRRIRNFSSFDVYTSPQILKNGCALTVVITDPRIPLANITESLWFTLESIATYSNTSWCVVLQTSACKLMNNTQNLKNILPIAVASEAIYSKAMPAFRRMMEAGQVRITILNHTKYGLKSCSDFYNPSSAFMNINYWQDEFIQHVDSDMILIMQDDSVLCGALDITLWSDLAYVGALWAPKESPLWLVPKLGMCNQMKMYWRTWTARYKKFEPMLSNLCERGFGPVGNGGLSLRNKSWMIRAIETCPYTPYSGIPLNKAGVASGCKVTRQINEDVYFATVLNGIHAPMPTAYEASLFTTEMLWAEQADEFYGPYSMTEKENMILKRWGAHPASLEKYRRMHDINNYVSTSSSDALFTKDLLRTIPIGLHKPWWYHPNHLLQGKQVQKECKFLKYMFDAQKDSRWDAAMAEAKRRAQLEEERKKRFAKHPNAPQQSYGGKISDNKGFVERFRDAFYSLIKTETATCGNGQVGNGRCPIRLTCCSKWGYCGSGAEYCGHLAKIAQTADNEVASTVDSVTVKAPKNQGK